MIGTDASEPDKISELYTKPFEINKTLTVKAKNYKKGLLPSYTINVDFEKFEFMDGQKISKLQSGLEYEYFEGFCPFLKDMKKLEVVDTGIISNFSIDKIKDERAFGYTYNGFIKIKKTGVYTFHLKTNDGGGLWINDVMIVDNDGSHVSYDKSGRIALNPGFHTIKLEYFQQGRAKNLEAEYEGTGINKQLIPDEVLFH